MTVNVSLDQFSVADAVELGSRLRSAGTGATSMEEVANAVVRTIAERIQCSIRAGSKAT